MISSYFLCYPWFWFIHDILPIFYNHKMCAFYECVICIVYFLFKINNFYYLVIINSAANDFWSKSSHLITSTFVKKEKHWFWTIIWTVSSPKSALQNVLFNDQNSLDNRIMQIFALHRLLTSFSRIGINKQNPHVMREFGKSSWIIYWLKCRRCYLACRLHITCEKQ